MMAKRLILFLILFVTVSFASLMKAQTTSHQWQPAQVINGNFKAVSTQPDMEVFSAPNIILLKVNQEIDVRVFSILGKLISSEHLEPGIFEFKLDAHGIYIIKTEESSCKIAI